MNNPQKTKYYIYITLFFLIIIGILLRVYRIGFQCSWTEEDYTAMIAAKPFFEIWTEIISTDFTPPLFYWLEHFVGIYIGITDETMRYLPALFGILSIPMMYWLGKLYKDELTGLYAAGITTILYPLMLYSQFARAYTLPFFFFAITLVLYIQITNKNYKKLTFIFFGIVSGICVWSHMFTIIPISLLVIDTIISTRAPAIKSYVLGTYILTLVPLIQMPITFLTQRVSMNGILPYGLKWYELIAITPLEFFNNAFPIIGLLIVYGLFIDRTRITTIKLFVIAVVTIVSGLILSSYTMVFARYYLFVTVIFIIIVSIALSGISDHLVKNNIKLKIVILICILLILVFFQNSDIINHYVLQKYAC